jgi:hypothetical protein
MEHSPVYPYTFGSIDAPITLGKKEYVHTPDGNEWISYPVYLLDAAVFADQRIIRRKERIGDCRFLSHEWMTSVDRDEDPLLHKCTLLFTAELPQILTWIQQASAVVTIPSSLATPPLPPPPTSLDWKAYVRTITTRMNIHPPCLQSEDPSVCSKTTQLGTLLRFPRDTELHFFLTWLSRQSLDKQRALYIIHCPSSDDSASSFWTCLQTAFQSVGIFMRKESIFSYFQQQPTPTVQHVEQLLQLKVFFMVLLPDHAGIALRTICNQIQHPPPLLFLFVTLHTDRPVHHYNIVSHQDTLLFSTLSTIPKDLQDMIRRDCFRDPTLCSLPAFQEMFHHHFSKKDAGGAAPLVALPSLLFTEQMDTNVRFRAEIEKQKVDKGLSTVSCFTVFQLLEDMSVDETVRFAKPGTLTSERIQSFDTLLFTPLLRHTHWRHQLHDAYRCEKAFVLENRCWRTIVHYQLFCQCRQSCPAFAEMLAVPTEIAASIAPATAAAPSSSSSSKKRTVRKRRRHIPDVLYESTQFAQNIAHQRDPRWTRFFTTPLTFALFTDECRLRALQCKFSQDLLLRSVLVDTFSALLVLPNQSPDWLLMTIRKQCSLII